MSNWEILQALVFEPRKAFAEIAERPKFWFPLLVLVIAGLVTAVCMPPSLILPGRRTGTCTTARWRAR
ncbi:MAG: hypothetical protein WDO12_03660 [Pseudomonadota bacterium]